MTPNQFRYIFLWPNDREPYRPSYANSTGPIAPGIYSKSPFVPGVSGGIWPIVMQVPEHMAATISGRLQPLVNEHFDEASPVSLCAILRNSPTFQEVDSLLSSTGSFFWAVLAAKSVCLYVDEKTAREAWMAPCSLMYKKMLTHSTWMGAFFAMAAKGQEPHVDLISTGWASPACPESQSLPQPLASMPPPAVVSPPVYTGMPASPDKAAGKETQEGQTVLLRTIPGTPTQSQRTSGPPLAADMSPFRIVTPPLTAGVHADPLSPTRSRNETHFGAGSPSGSHGLALRLSNGSSSPAGPIRMILRAARAIGGDPTGLTTAAEDYLNSHGYDNFNKNTILTTFREVEKEHDFIEKMGNILPGTPRDEAGFIYRMLFYRY
ncbi:hypothetical protein PQX77_003417 [Marasmius sp. AFHP31]|nr:hypothetical protein PQX77_003417 [Marasmius sp. AFHP31]